MSSEKKVIVAPLVLLSVVDHYKRMSSPRVVGVLLGTSDGSITDVTNSFAIPFEEYDDGFFIDTSYLHKMYELYHKVNPQEKILGWYHSASALQKSDLEISKAFLKYCPKPILAVINVAGETNDIPCQVFQLFKSSSLEHISVQIGADETEEVGVEHLLRDIKEGTGCSLKDKVEIIEKSLEAYKDSLETIIQYLKRIEDGAKPDLRIMELIQNILNEVPHINPNVNLSALYVAELSNAVVAMHDLESNSIENK